MKIYLELLIIFISFSLTNFLSGAEPALRDSDEDHSHFSVATSQAVGGRSALFDDLQEIEVVDIPQLTADDLMPFIPKSRNVSKKERRAHVEKILARAQVRGRGKAYLSDLQQFVAVGKTRNIGMPITINDDHIRPALVWLGKKVLKEDVELLNRKFDRQKVITGVSAVGSFVIASGLACLMTYLGTLY